MKSLSKALSLVAFLTTAAAAFGDSTYVLTYPDAANLDGFLAAQHLQKISQIPGEPIYRVSDSLNRSASQVIDAVEAFDAQDGVDDIDIFQNVSVGMSEEDSSAHLANSRSYLEAALQNRNIVSYFGAPAPAGFADQPAALQTWVPVARMAFGYGSGVVAVIDTGVDPDHAFLKPALLPGYDFTRDEAGAASEMRDLSPSQQAIVNPTTIPLLSTETYATVNSSTQALFTPDEANAIASDPLPYAFGHGTMVAGVIRMVAPGAKILPLKAFNSDGSGTIFNITRAIYYAKSHGANVINLSLSTSTRSRELERAIRRVTGQGVICVASAGNDGLRTNQVYPAAYSRVIGVASVNPIDARSTFSNYGNPLVTVSAPGEEMLCPFPGNRWAGGWGTSFAAPMVSGSVAMMLGVDSHLRGNDVRNALQHSSAPLEGEMGYGRLNVYQAVAELSGS